MTLLSCIPAEDGAEINPDILDCDVAAELLKELEDEIDQRYNVLGQARGAGVRGPAGDAVRPGRWRWRRDDLRPELAAAAAHERQNR